jgi:hypothetical protein
LKSFASEPVLTTTPAASQPSTFVSPSEGAELLRTLVSTGLTDTALTCTNKSRPDGFGSGNSTSINDAASEIGSD